jgi:hypothetical protein
MGLNRLENLLALFLASIKEKGLEIVSGESHLCRVPKYFGHGQLFQASLAWFCAKEFVRPGKMV